MDLLGKFYTMFIGVKNMYSSIEFGQNCTRTDIMISTVGMLLLS
jgi:hypothetical protein